MANPAAAFAVLPIGLLFLLSGLIVNLIQAIAFISIRPFSKILYRRINKVLVELLWIQLVWLVDWWAGLQVQIYADPETLALLGKEHALLVCNHRSDIDWLVGWVLAQRYGCLGSSIAIMKKSSKYLPVIGWSMWFSECLFLERNWAKDKSTLELGLKTLGDFPHPFWLALFVEGTRFTQAKLLAAQQYAIAKGLHVPKNVLIPRTKGFIAAVNNLRTFVPAIYDITVAIPKDQPSPTMLKILNGKSSMVQVYIQRHKLLELPRKDDELAQWCTNMFIAKDSLLDKHIVEGTFGNDECRTISRPLKPLLVVVLWTCLLSLATYYFFKWTSILSTWKGTCFLIFGLLSVAIVMHILIQFSESERSQTSKSTTRPKEEKANNTLTVPLIYNSPV